MLKRFDVQRQQQLAWWLLLLVICAYVVEMSHQALLRYDTFKATAFDLGNMDQVLWNTIHGRWFQFTNQAVDWYGPPTRLAIHFEPILLPLSLLYVFHADPRILLIFQTLALAAGALPVFLLTRKYLPEWPLLATLMAVAYLLSPALLGLNIFDFHPISLATPLLLYAVLALTYKRYAWFIVACILAASCKEDIPLTLAIFGLFLIWKYKLPRLGLIVTIGSLLWSFLAFGIIIPHFYPGAQHNNFWYRYESLGSSPAEAIVNLLLHPWLLFTTFITLNRMYYLASLFRSSGFLCLLAPEWLLMALPGLAENLLSTDPLLYTGVYHYNAAIIPFVVIASIHGARRFLEIWQTWRGTLSGGEVMAGNEVIQVKMKDKKVSEAAVQWRLNLPFAQWKVVQKGVAGTLSGTLFGGQVARVIRSFAVACLQRIPALRTGNGKTSAPLSGHPLRYLFPKQGPLSGGEVMRGIRGNEVIARLAAFTRARYASCKRWLSLAWQRFSERMVPLAKGISTLRLQWIMFAWIVFLIGLNLALIAPLLNSFWADHEPGSREQHIQQLLAMIPPTASVSASSNLNPHVSEREHLAVFPSISDTGQDTTNTVQYIIVDMNAIFPEDRLAVTNELNHLRRSGQYMQIAAAEGVVLLMRALHPSR